MRTWSKYLLVAVFSIGLIGCSDNSTSPESDPEAPSIPSVESEERTPEIDLFEENEPGDESMSAYNSARQTALGIQFSMMVLSNFDSYLTAAPAEDDASFDDGVWVWTYSQEYEEQSVDIRLTAEAVSEGIEWNMYWTFDDGNGNSYEDAHILGGIVSEDGSQGEFEFYSPNNQTGEVTPVLTYSWEIVSDTEKNITLTGLDESGSETGRIEYEYNAPEHTMVLTESDAEPVTVFWNEDTKEGYIEQNGDRNCWDESLENTPCN